MSRLLIINPNSSESITRTIASAVKNAPSDCKLTFMTAPPDAPPSINNPEEGMQSANAIMKLFKSDPEKYLGYDGYLVCCFSDHPLIYKLREHFEGQSKRPIVLGIFQAALSYALGFIGGCHSNSKACVLTSGNDCRPLIDKSIYEYFCGPSTAIDNYSTSLPPYFHQTKGAGLGVLELSDPKNFTTLTEKADILRKDGVKYIILGCAGLCCVDVKLKEMFPEITWIDSCKCGIETICAFTRLSSS